MDQKVVDFSADLRALMMTTLIHCFTQADLILIINDLWNDQHNDESFLAARLYATHLRKYVIWLPQTSEDWREEVLPTDRFVAGGGKLTELTVTLSKYVLQRPVSTCASSGTCR